MKPEIKERFDRAYNVLGLLPSRVGRAWQEMPRDERVFWLRAALAHKVTTEEELSRAASVATARGGDRLAGSMATLAQVEWPDLAVQVKHAVEVVMRKVAERARGILAGGA